MTNRDREDRFIEKCKKAFGMLTFESEQLLRYGFSSAAEELSYVGYVEGIAAQRATVLDALGVAPGKIL